MKYLLSLLLSGMLLVGYAQSYPLNGGVVAEDDSPLLYATVALLSPKDSTLQFFGITNNEGRYDIKNIRKGEYLLQIAFMGYETYYQPVTIPVSDNSLARIKLSLSFVAMDEVSVVSEYVPIAFRGDTTEFKAAAFQIKPDATTEELLKKMPGIEVDRAGNIKALGEDVKRVMVNGKEFFGNDPKVATKNLPANAIDKVQIYDRTSEESMFTGISDGSRERTINLALKEDHKNGLFGNATAGGGTGEHWMGNARAYRFTGTTQMALLGMANNVNQSGFSFDDYMNFSGGALGMQQGGGSTQIRITNDGSFPINFGQPMTGLNTSGAGGANLSFSKSNTQRLFLSYMGTNSSKELVQSTTSQNFRQGSTFDQLEALRETDKNQSHRFNFGLRTRIDSASNIVVDGNMAISGGDNLRNTGSQNLFEGSTVSSQTRMAASLSDRYFGNVSGSYVRKLNYASTILKISGSGSFSQGDTRQSFRNETSLQELQRNLELFMRQTQNVDQNTYNSSVALTLTQKVGRLVYLEPEIRAAVNSEILNRSHFQGFYNEILMPVDSLSPNFRKEHAWVRPRIGLIRNTQRARFNLGLQLENGKITSHLNEDFLTESQYTYLLPSFFYENGYRPGRRISSQLSTIVNAPLAAQLLPVINNINPLSVFYGNPQLKPERIHRLNLNWMIFDQFSFTSLMTMLSGSYTKDKINWDRTISDNLLFVNTLINAEADWEARANIDFSTPIRPIGMKIRVNLEERWNRGSHLVNQAENTYTNYIHRGSISLDNRKKEKWDIYVGVEARLTQAFYSLQSTMNNHYMNLSWFSDVRYTPNQNWNFSINADVANYTDKAFGEAIQIPLLHAEISRYLLKNKRGTLTLRGFDLLDKNNVVQRISEQNYLREVRSNSIGRYFLLSFSYRLSQLGDASRGI